jgi:subtilase family serine protease
MFVLSRHICGWLAACTLVTPFLGAQTVAPRISSAISSSEQATLKGSLHPMAQAQFDAGRLSSSTKLTGISIVFNRTDEQEADLQALITAQQDPSSPSYHQWLTPDQFAAHFGMADADLNKVKSWLEQQGFSVDSVARSKNMIRFSGTVGQVEQAFSTQMHSYKASDKQHFAPSTVLSVPTALSSVVLAVRNLDDFRPKPMHVGSVLPAYTSSQSGSVFFAPGDIKTAYDIPSGYTGTGQSIAIMGQSAIVVSDIEKFQTASGLTTKDPTLVLVPGTGTSTINTGDELESDLDLEWAGGIATGAKIIFVYTGNSNNNNGVFDSLTYAVDENIAPIISFSYGECETDYTSSTIKPYETVLAQAATQGQTVIVSSGDSGSTACSGYTHLTTTQQKALAVSYPASSAYVTAMGGTEITSSNDAVGTYWTSAGSNPSTVLKHIPEVAWNDDSSSNGLSSTGGGTSALISRPAWQTGVTGISSGSYRLVPDISLYSSLSYPGYLYCSSDTGTDGTGVTGSCSNGFRDTNSKYLTIAGGTSFAAPVFAGMVALINEAKNYTEGQGLINTTLYDLATTSTAYSSTSPIFYDITAGTSSGTTGVGNECLAGTTYCSNTTQYPTTTGYDEATGLGSVNLANLITNWPANTATSASLIGTTTTITAATAAPAVGASDTFTITVVAVSGSATPTGTVNLTIDSSTTATATLSASGTAGTATATYATSFSASGTHQIVAQYAGDTTFALSSGAVQVTVASSGSGTGTGTNTGTSSSATITITPAGGYTGTVTFSASTSSAALYNSLNVCYIINDASVSGTAAVTQTLTLEALANCATTDVRKGAANIRLGNTSALNKISANPAPPVTRAAFGFLGLVFAGLLGWRSKKLRGLASLMVLVTLSFTLSGCGGGSKSGTTTSKSFSLAISPTTVTISAGNSGAPTGTYNLTLTGTDSSSSSITSSATITLVID